jgi:hypothetical protein
METWDVRCMASHRARNFRCKAGVDFVANNPGPNHGIPEPHNLFHDRTVVVTSCGRLCLYRKKINLSSSLAGQAVGVKDVNSGISLGISRIRILGYIDLEEKLCSPWTALLGRKSYLCLSNNLLPMSPGRTQKKLERETGLEPATSSLGI